MLTVEVVDSRRLTGPNLYTRGTGAVADVRFGWGEDLGAPKQAVEGFILRWRAALAQGLAALGWASDAPVHVRRFTGGAELMVGAAIDRLYAATDLNEWAIEQSARDPSRAVDETGLVAIAEAAQVEVGARVGLASLVAAAEAHEVAWLVDDDQLSLAYFDACQAFPLAALPRPDALDWPALARASRAGEAKLALITGTNGKTTTTRMLARIVSCAGACPGNTSTDGLFVGEALVDAGDWTGPGGARAVLRDPRVDVALLEAARGGLLRRGAGVSRCRVASITNVSADHLGEYGVLDLDTMADAKGIIATLVDARGRVVLGADSPALVRYAARAGLDAPIVWFSLEADHPRLEAARARGSQAEAWSVVDGQLCRFEGGARVDLGPVDALPTSLGGRAAHNVQNALAAAAVARGLGFDDVAIWAGLRSFGAAASDNPGRARLERLALRGGGSVEVLLDFAHNVAGLDANAAMLRAFAVEGAGPGAGASPSIQLCFGMAGDRSDDELHALGQALARFDPRRVVLREQPDYLRGRPRGQVPAALERGLRAGGFGGPVPNPVDSEVASLELALADARPGELIAVFAHVEREAVDAWLADRSS